MQSDATTVELYLAELPDDRRDPIETVRDIVVENLPEGYEETMNWGMIVYSVPLETYPDTYNGQPLMYAALASQKSYMSLYLTAVWAADGIREDFLATYRESGKRLDMGKSCVRFRSVDDLPLDLVADTIAAFDPDSFIEAYESSRR